MFEEDRKREESAREYDRETALKWQDLALTQLGYVINLFLTFGVGIVAYLSKEVLEHPPGFSMPATSGFRWGVWIVGMSVAAGILANVTRTVDYRYTRERAHAKWAGRHFRSDGFRVIARYLGTFTWFLFYLQALGFGVGVFLLARGVWHR